MSDNDPRVVPIPDPPRRDHSNARGAAQEPPRQPFTEPPPRPESIRPKPSGATRRLRDKLAQGYATLGFITCATAQARGQALGGAINGDPDHDGKLRQAMQFNAAGINLVSMSETAADSWIELAEQNPAVRRALERMTESSAIASVVITHGMIAVPFAVALGVLPDTVSDQMEALTNLANAANAAQTQNGNGRTG